MEIDVWTIFSGLEGENEHAYLPSSVEGQESGHLNLLPSLTPQIPRKQILRRPRNHPEHSRITSHSFHAMLCFDVPMTSNMTTAHRRSSSSTAKGQESEIIEGATPTTWVS
ncbi:hypothetical protein CGRA01v4_07924 [Colletotrichum graminicola]|nr:hypothetical protein CGRA01v4_07924 [Colletotrichum graminicola]